MSSRVTGALSRVTVFMTSIAVYDFLLYPILNGQRSVALNSVLFFGIVISPFDITDDYGVSVLKVMNFNFVYLFRSVYEFNVEVCKK